MKKTIRVYNDIVVITLGSSTFADFKFVALLISELPLGSYTWERGGSILKIDLDYKEEVIHCACESYDEVIEEEMGIDWVQQKNPRQEQTQEQQQQKKHRNPMHDQVHVASNQVEVAWMQLWEMLSEEDTKSVYKALSKRFHPDTGGSNEKMIKLNDIFSRLRK